MSPGRLRLPAGGWKVAQRRGLTYRMALVGGVVALLMIGAFAFLFMAIAGLRDAGAIERRSEAALVSADRLEKLMLGLDAESRGLVVSTDPSFLASFTADRAALPAHEADLVRASAKDNPEQARWAPSDRAGRQRVRARLSRPAGERGQERPRLRAVDGGEGTGTAAADGSAQPVRGVREHPAQARHRMEQHAIDAAHTATVTAAFSGAGALLLIGFFVTYLTRVIIRPVRHAALVAGGLTKGDLAVPDAGDVARRDRPARVQVQHDGRLLWRSP